GTDYRLWLGETCRVRSLARKIQFGAARGTLVHNKPVPYIKSGASQERREPNRGINHQLLRAVMCSKLKSNFIFCAENKSAVNRFPRRAVRLINHRLVHPEFRSSGVQDQI